MSDRNSWIPTNQVGQYVTIDLIKYLEEQGIFHLFLDRSKFRIEMQMTATEIGIRVEHIQPSQSELDAGRVFYDGKTGKKYVMRGPKGTAQKITLPD